VAFFNKKVSQKSEKNNASIIEKQFKPSGNPRGKTMLFIMWTTATIICLVAIRLVDRKNQRRIKCMLH